MTNIENKETKLKALLDDVFFVLREQFKLKNYKFGISYTNGNPNFPYEYNWYVEYNDWDGKRPTENDLNELGLRFVYPNGEWEKSHTDSYPSGCVNYYRKQIVSPLLSLAVKID